MTRQIPPLIFALCASILWRCANPVSWENDIHIPVLDDRVTWADVVADSLYEAGVEGGPAHFVLVDTLDGWDWTDWTQIPDSTITVRYDGGDALENGLPVADQTQVVGYTDALEFVLNEPEGIKLTDARLSSGMVAIDVKHSLQCYVNMNYQFPGILVEGEPLEFVLPLPPATEFAPGQGSQVLDLSGASLDFSQAEGFDSNALQVSIAAISGEVTDPSGVYFINAEDSVVVSLTFQSLTVDELGGYFGTLTESTSADVELLDTIPLPEPVIDLEGTTAALHFTNTIAADLRLYLDTLQFDQTLVEGDLIAGHDIPRAVWVGDEPVAGEWSLDLGDPNSTFLDALEGFPKNLHVAGRMTLNPNNNSDLLLDRWDVAYPPTFWYELRVPLKLGVNGLVLEDSFDVEGLDEFPGFKGHLHLDFESSFPVEVTGEVNFNRADGVLYQDTLVLPAGSVPNGTLGEATLSIPISAEMALPGGVVDVALRVNTFGPQPFTGYESIRIQGRLEGTQTIEVE